MSAPRHRSARTGTMRRGAWLLAAAMAVPMLLQLILLRLSEVLPAGQDGGWRHAACAVAALAGGVLLVRIEAARAGCSED